MTLLPLPPLLLKACSPGMSPRPTPRPVNMAALRSSALARYSPSGGRGERVASPRMICVCACAYVRAGPVCVHTCEGRAGGQPACSVVALGEGEMLVMATWAWDACDQGSACW